MRPKRRDSPPFVFSWALGVGPDPAALRRLVERSPEPREPMGEAWFMSEKRRLYTEAQGVDPSEWPIEMVERLLSETTTGPVCFGPMEEWWDWYHYLLPRILPRGSETHIYATLMEQLISGFIAIHPTGIVRVPNGNVSETECFRRDVLNTLGRAVMSPDRWEGGEPSAPVKELFDLREVTAHAGWDLVGGAFASSMFFCWKYFRLKLGPGCDPPSPSPAAFFEHNFSFGCSAPIA